MKKLTLLALSTALLGSSVTFAANNLGSSGSALNLTHDEIFGIYKRANLVRDELELPDYYQGSVSAMHLSLKRLDGRLRSMSDDLSLDLYYDHSDTKDQMEIADKKLDKMILNLRDIVKKLHKIDNGYTTISNEIDSKNIKKPNMIDFHYSLAVISEIKAKKVIQNTQKMVNKNEIGDSWAHEINFIGKILFDISNGYKEKSLKLILERGDTTGQTIRTYAEALNFKF